MIFKKIIILLLTFCILTGSVYAQDSVNRITVHLEDEGIEQPPDITAGAAVVINLQSEDVIYEKNAADIIYPGPAVKIMTAILAVEHIEDPANTTDFNTKIVTSDYVVNNTRGWNIDMKEGEVFTVEDLINAILVNNANDACLAIAELIAGTADSFVAKMNEKARELGCLNTVYTNPHGIHSDEMYTTAFDVAKIALYASKISLIMDISSKASYEIPATNKTAAARNLLNRNHLVSKTQHSNYFYEHARGMNTGSTEESGFCLVTVGQQYSTLSYLCVVMGATLTHSSVSGNDIINSFSDARKLLEWAFLIYSYRVIVRRGEQISTVKIDLAATRDEVTLIAEDEISLLLPRNADIAEEIERVVMIYDDSLFAPIERNQMLGEISVIYKGEIAGVTGLLATTEIEPSNILHVLDQIRDIVSRPWFGASVTIFIILFAAYVALSLVRRNRRERKRFY